jgi:NTE family protein
LRGGVKAWEAAGLPLIPQDEAAPKAPSKQERKTAAKRNGTKKSINLALQGGGTHGAFTWGVLDRLLEDDRIYIEAISGTSAGAINAVIIADGLMESGREGARQALEGFWWSISHTAQFSPIKRTPLDVLTGNWNLDRSPSYLFFEVMEQLASPYLLNPLNLNPIKMLLARQVNFERVRKCDLLKVFISATNVRTGRVKLFERTKLTLDMVMASASLPYLFQAVEIDGEAYWDGGYSGNPVLYPFAYQCTSKDVVIVQINPMCRDAVPKTAHEILNRINEITFNGSLMKELRAIEFVGRLLDSESVDPARYKKMLLHVINAEEELKYFNASSKFNAEWGFLTHLRTLGRLAAERWLDTNYDTIGEGSSVDLRALFE